MFRYSRFSVTSMSGQQYVLLLLFFLFSVKGDESEELFESAVKNICGSSNFGNVNEACLQKLVNSYFDRFSWCQSTRASCFVCSSSNLVRLARKIMSLLIMVQCTVINFIFSFIHVSLFHRQPTLTMYAVNVRSVHVYIHMYMYISMYIRSYIRICMLHTVYSLHQRSQDRKVKVYLP